MTESQVARVGTTLQAHLEAQHLALEQYPGKWNGDDGEPLMSSMQFDHAVHHQQDCMLPHSHAGDEWWAFGYRAS